MYVQRAVCLPRVLPPCWAVLVAPRLQPLPRSALPVSTSGRHFRSALRSGAQSASLCPGELCSCKDYRRYDKADVEGKPSKENFVPDVSRNLFVVFLLIHSLFHVGGKYNSRFKQLYHQGPPVNHGNCDTTC